MRVLIVSTSYPENGDDWRGIFMKNLLSGLARKSNLSLRLWSPPGDIPGSVKHFPLPGESAWLKDLMNSGGIAHVLRTQGMKSVPTVLGLLYRLRRAYARSSDVDVLHVNWLQNALPLWGIRKPAVISVLGNDFGLLSKPGMTTLLRSVIAQRKCVLAPNGEWMIPELEERFGDIAKVRYIPLGVDSFWFDIKRAPDLCATRKWLVISRLTENKIGPLFTWGERVFTHDDELHLFGPMQEEMDVPQWVHYHGPVAPAQLRDEWYPKAAGLITLSRHDEGRPQVILEAMAAGLPVVASDISAHSNVIQHKTNGILVASREDFRNGLEWLSQLENNARAGKAAREWIIREVGTWDDCASRYIAAYETVSGI